MRLIALYTCLSALTFLGACQSGDSFLLSPDQADNGSAQDNALGPVRPQDTVPAFPQNQAPAENSVTATATAPIPTTQQHANNVPAGPTTNPVEVADNGDPDEIPPQGDGGVVGQAGAGGALASGGGARQGSLAQAASAQQPAEDSETRAVIQPSRGRFGGQFNRQINSILGGDRVRVNSDVNVSSEMVVGNWSLSEEDGMRSCTIGFGDPEDGNAAQASGGCSPEIGGIQSWGVFGDDLLLRDSQNSVVVRLRRSGEAWVGFTLQAGIPIVLSRG